jgi:hypothetical protein
MHLIIFIIIISISQANYQNRTKFNIVDEPITGIINSKSRVKIVFISKNNVPFELILYTETGIPLHFRGTKMSYTGFPTYYQINNISDQNNKIILEIYEIGTDWTKMSYIIITICSIFILICYKREHTISRICLFILLSFEIYKATDYDKVADRIIHKILF